MGSASWQVSFVVGQKGLTGAGKGVREQALGEAIVKRIIEYQIKSHYKYSKLSEKFNDIDFKTIKHYLYANELQNYKIANEPYTLLANELYLIEYACNYH